MIRLNIVILIFWIFTGAVFGVFFIGSSLYLIFEKLYEGKIYPGVRVADVDFGGKRKEEVRQYFQELNDRFSETHFSFSYDNLIATVSARQLNFGFDSQLLAEQAYSLGRSRNIFTDLGILFAAKNGEISLSSSYAFSEDVLREMLREIEEEITIEPLDSLFTFQNGRVTAFQPSSEGLYLDWDELTLRLKKKFPLVSMGKQYTIVDVPIPTKIVLPKVETSQVNTLGIRELVGSGSSRFSGSIANRIHNITLAAARLNGILVKPGGTLSFNDALGDVSKFTGYKESYIIKDGRTILGDGGGVCQVSTTLFRAVLQSGLPIVERVPHSYRVGYYEQDSLPGFDATVYASSVDFKFKNDTEQHILIQAFADTVNMRLRFELYGTSDGRRVTISKSIVTNQVPPPPDLYQDDPNLPKGTLKQIDFKAWGADVVFSRNVERSGEILISENFRSHYRPWQAVFLRGTKE